MDNRRLSTRQILEAGIHKLPDPETKAPLDIPWLHICEHEFSKEAAREALEAGSLACSMYYGVWNIWRAESGYSGELLQYHEVTEQFEALSLDDALVEAVRWAAACSE